MRNFLMIMGLFGLSLAMPAIWSTSRHEGPTKNSFHFSLNTLGSVGSPAPVRAVAADKKAGDVHDDQVNDETPGPATGTPDENTPPVNPSGITGKQEHKKIQIDLSDLVIRPV